MVAKKGKAIEKLANLLAAAAEVLTIDDLADTAPVLKVEQVRADFLTNQAACAARAIAVDQGQDAPPLHASLAQSAVKTNKGLLHRGHSLFEIDDFMLIKLTWEDEFQG